MKADGERVEAVEARSFGGGLVLVVEEWKPGFHFQSTRARAAERLIARLNRLDRYIYMWC